MAPPPVQGTDALANISSSDSEARDPGDMLNGIGSTSSLASTASSVFSTNAQAVKTNGYHMSASAAAALTPLTHPATSPVKSASPHPFSKPLPASALANPSPLGRPVADTRRGPSEHATPHPPPPSQRPQLMPHPGKAKGYRALEDPELDNKLGKEEKKRAKVIARPFGVEPQDPPPDPRLAIVGYKQGRAVPSHIQSKTKMRIAPYVLKPYPHDAKTSIGPNPPKQIVVHGYDPFTPDGQLKTFFSSFGDISEFRNHTDPNTGSFLGICSVKYKDSKPLKGVSVSAANCAKRAEKEGNNERIGLSQIKVERDREGRKCRRYIEVKLKRAKHELEKVTRVLPRAVSVAEPAPTQSPAPAPAPAPAPPPAPTPTCDSPAPPVNAPRGPAAKRGPPSAERIPEKERISGQPIVESEPVLSKIKRKPYIFIPHDSVPVLPSTVPHLKKRFKAFAWREVRLDKTGYYVVFDDSKRGEDETVRCFKECNDGPMFTYTMSMECQQYGNPNYERSPSPETQAVLKRKRDESDRLQRWAAEDLEDEKKQRAADLDPVKGALEQLKGELRAKIMDDIKTRVAIPTLYDCLDPARHVAKRQKFDLPDPEDNENKLPTLLINKASETPPGTPRSRNGRPLSHSKPLRPHDPNRGRGVPSTNAYIDERRKQRPPPRAVHARPLHYRLQQMFPDDDEEDSDDERRTSMTRDTEDQESRPRSRASRTSTPFNDVESIDSQTPRHKKQKLVHKEPIFDPEEEQETFGSLQKELLGDLLQKDPVNMATRELELVINTLPRSSNFQSRARNELYVRQRAKYDDDPFRTKADNTPASTPAPAIEITKADQSVSKSDATVDSSDLAVKPVRDRSKRKRKSKKQIFEEREALRAAARAAVDPEAMEEDTISQGEENEVEIEGIEEDVVEESDKPQVEWAASADKPRRTVEDDEDAVLDIDGWQHVLKDDEDLRFIQKALEDERLTDVGDSELWAWKQKEIKSLNTSGGHGPASTSAKIQGYYVPNPTGSARTEGVKKILESEKSKYLPHRIRVQKQREERQAQAQENPTAAVEAAKAAAAAKLLSTASSRSNRANNRRLVNDINLQKQNLSTTGAETDAIKFNQLKKRKKLVKFDRSAIHGWGLYAMENIAFNDLIIEYVGEKVRQKVADLREQKYDKQGIGSSYLFRMVDDEIVDATKKGGIARFINHSCTPNCTARIIKVEGTRRIVIYALKDIAKNEELTYDYKFEREYGSDDRIPCLCGSVGCKGFLN